MLKSILVLMVLSLGVAEASPYNYNSTDFVKKQQRDFNEEWDRVENRMNIQEQTRLLREIQRQNEKPWRYGR